jgi:hypothetical protein
MILKKIDTKKADNSLQRFISKKIPIFDRSRQLKNVSDYPSASVLRDYPCVNWS